MKIFLHLSNKSIVDIQKENPEITWKEIKAHYKKPPWCFHKNPIDTDGCWDLLLGDKTNISDCFGCQLRSNSHNNI